MLVQFLIRVVRYQSQVCRVNPDRMTEIPPNKRLILAAVTPSLLERGALWFRENEEKIIKASHSQPWWRARILILEEGEEKKYSAMLRALAELGYEKSLRVSSQGEFAAYGDTIRIAPINREDIARLEFRGNTLERIAFESFERTAERKGKKRATVFLPGEFVVHIDHGIGIYRGLQQATHDDAQEFHVIEYAAPRKGAPPDRLLVPRDQEKRLSLYIGFETPSLHRLGSQIWPKTKRKIKESAEAFARELLAIYAAREGVERPPLEGDPATERAFADSFPFIETPSQREAILAIERDLESANPMDRIIAGDVGFGKTEVAMRAIFRAVLSGKQAAMLAPTTILVEQHRRTFIERFAGFPVEIAALSRVTPREEERAILARLAAGKVDIVLGTHRLMSKDVSIPKLGLLVIDEEQRFGVRHKEHFKKFRRELDVLSLSATPIPRTLSLAMAHMRAISQVNDPPLERIAVKNFVLPWNDRIVREAIDAEQARGGQVYILHNRVETISSFARMIGEIVPGARIGILHGRLDEKSLLRELNRFRTHETDILVATTIIENGLDFSNVNTLIVENAAKLGLAQAYQIRGRIGRGDRQAFAYFLYPAQHLTPEAQERLETLEAFEALGSGYEIALRDLEMRGAGAILGKEQSGAVQKGGFNLYCQLLEEALETLKNSSPI